jgi:hypothetical protein
MRPQKIEPWELAAQLATERLQQALAVLLAQEKALDSGTLENEKFFGALNQTNHTKTSVFEWMRVWRDQTETLKTSRVVALSVFRECLPLLLGAVDKYGQSLAIIAISPDLDQAHDGDLAGHGLKEAKEVASITLQLLDETPALRHRDRAVTAATLEDVRIRSKTMFELATLIRHRVRELRQEGGYGP